MIRCDYDGLRLASTLQQTASFASPESIGQIPGIVRWSAPECEVQVVVPCRAAKGRIARMEDRPGGADPFLFGIPQLQ
jgi:hypothetical protein